MAPVNATITEPPFQAGSSSLPSTMPSVRLESASRHLRFLVMALMWSSCALPPRTAAAQDIYSSSVLEAPTRPVTLREVLAVLANYPEDTTGRDYDASVKNCMDKAARTPAPAASGLRAAAPAIGGLQGLLLQSMGNSVAVGTNPEASACVARAEQIKLAREAELERTTPPEARVLWRVFRDFEACVRRSRQTRGVPANGACPQGNSAPQEYLDKQGRRRIEGAGAISGSNDTPTMPNRGTHFGGATHWVTLSYTPGDENLLSAPMPKPSSATATTGGAKEAPPLADDSAALDRWPKKMLTFQEALSRLGPYQDHGATLVATQDPFAFTYSGSPGPLRIAIAPGYFPFEPNSDTPDCSLFDNKFWFLRIGNTVEPSASCPRVFDMQTVATLTGGPAPTPMPTRTVAPVMAPPAAIAATNQPLGSASPAAAGSGAAMLDIEYIGQALSHRSGKMAIPATATQVRVSMWVLADALGANDRLSVSSRQPRDHDYVKSVVVTDGSQSFDFNNPQHNVEVLLQTDARRNISSWRVRAALQTGNGTRYIRIFGPGFEKDPELDPKRFNEQVAGSECLGRPTDVSFNRGGGSSGNVLGLNQPGADTFLAQSCAAGTWQISVRK